MEEGFTEKRNNMELEQVHQMSPDQRRRHFDELRRGYEERGEQPPNPLNPFISLGHQGPLVDSSLVDVRGEGDKYPEWYNILQAEISRPDLEPTVKAKLWAEIVSYERLFVPAPPHLQFKRISEYLPSASSRQDFPIADFSVLRLNVKGQNHIRSLLVYARDHLDKGVTHSALNMDNIYVNEVGDMQVDKPDGVKGDNEEEYIHTELEKFSNVIQQMALGEGGVLPSDVQHLVGLLNVADWRANLGFILNHPCFWSTRKVEGVIGCLRNICKRDPYGDGAYIRDAMRRAEIPLHGMQDWVAIWLSMPDVGFLSCIKSNLSKYGHWKEGQEQAPDPDHSNMLFFIRDLFVKGHKNHDLCNHGTYSTMSGRQICNIVHFLFPSLLSDFAYNIYTGGNATEEMENILFS